MRGTRKVSKKPTSGRGEADGAEASEGCVGATGVRAPGLKFDAGKTRWDLVPLTVIESIAEVMTHGQKKYGANNWQALEDFEGRYFAACMRHLVAWRTEEHTDPESGLPHLAHALTCLTFLLSKDLGFDPILDEDAP